MGIKKAVYVVFLCILAEVVLFSSVAQSALTGLDIMKKVEELPQGDDQKSTVTLLLTSAQGQEKKIITNRYWKNYRGKDGFYSKTLFFTNHPPDAKGTGFLIWDYAEEGKTDGLWLYLPSLRKVSVISTRSQDDAFMGSDLTFADMGQRRLDEDSHELIGEKPCDGKACYVVESRPKEAGSAYGKRVFWILKDEWRAVRIEYFDQKKDPLKVQNITWQKNGDLWVWEKAIVKNLQTGHSTVFEISDLKMNNGLRDDLFTDRMLKRGEGP
ncbi:MAG TPA: outer membrane lipoprotein-sorting protein [Nitrospirota bacterium]|nr:outer membrane lipoprotein-sorting protein [Nitrospirota bacterium]